MHNTSHSDFIEHDFPYGENTEATVHVADVGEGLFAPVPPNIIPLRVQTARRKHLPSVPRALRFQKYQFPHLSRPITRFNWHDLQAGAWDAPLYRTIAAEEGYNRLPHLPGFENDGRVFAEFLRKHAVQLSVNERGELVRIGTYIRTAANARRLIRFANRAYGKLTLRTLELAHDAIHPLLQTELRPDTKYEICASHFKVSKKSRLRTFSPVYVATSHKAKPTCKSPQIEPCAKCAVGSWTDDRDPITKDWQRRADDRLKLGRQLANLCSWCGDSVPSGVWQCKNCHRELQAAPVLFDVDTSEFVYEDGHGRHLVTRTEDLPGIQEIVRRKGHQAERVSRDQLLLVLDLAFPRWRDPSYAPEEPYERAIQLYALTIARRFEWHVYQGWTAQEVAAQENVMAARYGYPRNIKRAAISKFVRETDQWVREVLATFDMLGKQPPS
jgi:hypothetical protein